ncbi:MAG: DUF2007 domain-containing protein [Rhodospirillales bacterium]
MPARTAYPMAELTRTDDAVFLSWLRHALAEAGIRAEVFDSHTASLMPGVLGHLAARVMVAEPDLGRARLILAGRPDGSGAA